MIHSLLITAAIAAAVPAAGAKVETAEGRNPPGAAQRHDNSFIPPNLVAVRVAKRPWQTVREWRDPLETYAIVWTARTDAYQALAIVGDRYDTLPDDSLSKNRPKLHADFNGAYQAINAHWRIVSGKEVLPPPIKVPVPSPAKLRRMPSAKSSPQAAR